MVHYTLLQLLLFHHLRSQDPRRPAARRFRLADAQIRHQIPLPIPLRQHDGGGALAITGDVHLVLVRDVDLFKDQGMSRKCLNA